MKMRNARQWLAGGTLAAALALPIADSGAVVYIGSFDPPNFRGTATFDVAQACLSVGTGFATPGMGGCTVSWLAATVEFTDSPGLTFDYSALLPDSGIVSSIWVSGGELGGVISGALGPTIITGSDPAFNGPWWIQFAFAPPSISALDGPPSSGGFGLGVVYLYGGTCSDDIDFVRAQVPCTRNPNPAETADVEFFRRVPEPGSVALLLIAAAGAWWGRRRSASLA